ncbi:transmembrane sensor [Bradyrhizobium sp. USDA 10063]
MTAADRSKGELESLRREAWTKLLHLTSGHASKADVAALKVWCAQSPRHAEIFAQVSGRWRVLGAAIGNVAQTGHPMRAGADASVRAQIGRRALLVGALGASAAGAAVMITRPPMGLWPSLGELAADYRTVTGERRHIALDERASLDMNTRTTLNVRAASGGSDQIELIGGEAAFATRSKPVEVLAGNGRAWADDAQFSVRRNGSDICVTCLEGLVHVQQEGRSATLQKKQQVIYDDRNLGHVQDVDPLIVTAWREGELLFQNERLARVIEEVNRYRRGRIILVNDALGQKRFTAQFKLDRLEVVITQLKATFGARVVSLPGGVVLVS